MDVENTPPVESEGNDDAAHLDSFEMPDLEDEKADPDAPIDLDEEGEPIGLIDESNGLMDREAFWGVFSTAFDMPGIFIPDLAPLAIQPSEQSRARAASDATYRLLEIYFPSALRPGSETLAHLMVAGPFFIGKAIIVREIIRMRRMQPVQSPDDAPQNQETQADPDIPSIHDDWGTENG